LGDAEPDFPESCRGSGAITAGFSVKSKRQPRTPINGKLQASGSAARVTAFVASGPILCASFNTDPSLQPADKQAVAESDKT
jgi:hypothetical protein